MTDKQIIIINGVDVSGCEDFAKFGHSCRLMQPFGFCSQRINCYFKQLQREKQSSQEAKTLLKRKEQKLIKIKQYIEDNEWCILDKTYKELKQIIEDKENENS